MSRGGVHNALSRGLLPAALSRAVGDAEGESGLERYGETLTPTLNLWREPEWAYLRREALLGWEGTAAAVAGEFTGVGLVNPIGSGQIIVVDRVTAWATVALGFFLRRALEADVTATFLLDGGRGSQRDTRWTATFGPGTGHFWSGSDPAQVGIVVERAIAVAANTVTSFLTGLPFVITPGYAMVIMGAAVNNQVGCSWGYRERKAFPGELE